MNELKKIRESLNITQVEASKMLNISRRSYQKYEALENENDDKLQYYIYKLRELNLIDEEHGILKLDDIKREINNILSKYKINFCYLFGSYAKNKATPLSDIDLLIDSDITGLDFFGLVEELRQTLHKKIDLLRINQLENNQELLREIMKDGIKIYG
ncbi:MAG: nucleotidyltransferase domain-containing protein [Acholeplasmatales bacterium]|nr:nucleotidyltransferase domain-containing protein [Acholeplasmatales bacterium]